MNPTLIIFGIQSIVRLGRVTNDALERWARDAEAIFPEINTPDLSREVYINGFFNKIEYNVYVEGDNALYAEYWKDGAVIPEQSAIDALFTASVKVKAEKEPDRNRALSSGATFLVKQWNPENEKISPWARIILTAGDIALEYVASNPSILGLEGNGEKLIAAYAGNLGDLLPDNGEFGEKENFAHRLTGAFLRAGLDTISRNPEWIVSEEHLKELISASVKPLVNAIPGNITEQLKWQKVVDAIMGPAAKSALETVASNQVAFLGSSLNPDSAMGAVIQALFLEAAKDGLNDQFSKESMIGLYKAVLNVAAEKPQLFLKGDDPDVDFCRELFSKFSGVFRDSPPPFNREVAVALAGISLEAVGNNIHRFISDDGPWVQTSAEMVKSLTLKLKEALDTNKKLNNVFTKAQLIDMGRILLTHISETPQMVLGSGNEAWEGLITTVTSVMKEDKNLLLRGDDWIKIVQTAAEEAAANPVRLFKLDPDNPEDILAIKLIQAVLKSSEDILKTPGLKEKTVLFGKTLAETIIILLRATSGNPENAENSLLKIEELVERLGSFVAAKYDKYGNKEWLRLFRVMLVMVLDGRTFPEITDEIANDILKGGI